MRKEKGKDRAEPEEVGLLRVLSEPLRWQILGLLKDEELCVCHLVEELGVPQPLVSHHLRVLRESGLVDTSRHRYWTYYRLRPGALAATAVAVGDLAEAGSGCNPRRPCC